MPRNLQSNFVSHLPMLANCAAKKTTCVVRNGNAERRHTKRRTLPNHKQNRLTSSNRKKNTPFKFMKPTELAAWIGATTGLASLLWNIYTKLIAGPKLTVTAFANLVQRPAPPGDPRFLRITVQNVGTATTTITNLDFFTF